MVRVWIADVTPLLEGTNYRKYLEELSDFRRYKAEKHRAPEDRALSVGAGILMQYVLRELGAPEELAQGPAEEIPFLNISHSGKFCMCAFDDELSVKVGCDIEVMKQERMNVAKRFFCPSEYEHLLSLEDVSMRRDLFYRYWVLKESFIKATRRGMKMELDSFEIGWMDEGRGEPYLVRQPDDVKEKYYYREFGIPEEDVRLAVCAPSPDIACQIEKMHCFE